MEKQFTLKEFRDYIERLPTGHVCPYGISYPFSWRGSYDEVAFCIFHEDTTREEILECVINAYSVGFRGYKDTIGDFFGEDKVPECSLYRYDDNTPVHFEDDSGMYSAGEYCAEWIAKIEAEKPSVPNDIYSSQEERLVKQAFC